MTGVTAKDIAAHLGLSPSAVSLALNGKPGVSDQTRDAILETAIRLGYNSSRIPTMITSHRRLCFVFYVNRLVSIAENTTFSSFVLQGVESAASALGYSTQVRYLRAGESIEKQASEICEQADGIILLGTDVTPDSFSEIENFIAAARLLPMVVVDSFLLSDKLDCVGNDNYGGARQAAEYLLARGCKRIGYLRSKHRILNFNEREAGLRGALDEAGLEVAAVVNIGISFDEAIVDMNAYLDTGAARPDAFFAENDVIAAAATRVFKARNIQVPRQVSVVGFDNIPICDLADPALTTVHSFKERLGELSVELLHKRLVAGQNTVTAADNGLLRVALSTRLQIRNSVR